MLFYLSLCFKIDNYQGNITGSISSCYFPFFMSLYMDKVIVDI